jgi:hypothetical protein
VVSVTLIDDSRTDRMRLGLRSAERHALAMAMLCLLFVLMLAEPLVCVTYCQAEMQLGAHSLFVAQRQSHKPAPHNGMVAELTNVRPVILPNLFVCFMDAKDGFPSDMPNGLLAIEQHDHQATAVAIPLLMLILAVVLHLSAVPCALPHLALHPLPSATDSSPFLNRSHAQRAQAPLWSSRAVLHCIP